MEFISKYFDATKPYAFFEISCGQCKSMDDLFVEMAYVLSFPDYFWWGNRWDSLNDCMQDFGWIDEEFISISFLISLSWVLICHLMKKKTWKFSLIRLSLLSIIRIMRGQHINCSKLL